MANGQPGKDGARQMPGRIGAALAWKRKQFASFCEHRLARLDPATRIALRWPLRKPWQRSRLRLASYGGGLGDELMCLPIFREIKSRNAACEITFVSRYPELFAKHPQLARVEPYPSDGDPRALALTYGPVHPPRRPLFKLMAECAGLEIDPAELGPLLLEFPAEWRRAVAEIARPLVVVQPLAGRWTPNKNWPAEAWRELIGRLVERCEVIETGTQPLFPDADFGPRFRSFAGITDVAGFVALVAQADVFVGPSSAGMHVAAAFGIPSAIIFGGYESPAGYGIPGDGPYRRVVPFYTPEPCAPCWLSSGCPYDVKCLQKISAAEVFAAVCRLATTPDAC